jgi:hypothetical protein
VNCYANNYKQENKAMMYRGYWIGQTPEDLTYEIYWNHSLVEGGFETEEAAREYLDEMEA